MNEDFHKDVGDMIERDNEREIKELKAKLEALRKSADASHLAASENAARASRAEAQVQELRETVTRLNRRCQDAESAASLKVEESKKQGPSFGRALANWAAADYSRKFEEANRLSGVYRNALEEVVRKLSAWDKFREVRAVVDEALYPTTGGNPSTPNQDSREKPVGKPKCGAWTQWGRCVAEMPCRVHCEHQWTASGGDVCGICGEFKGPRDPNVPGVKG